MGGIDHIIAIDRAAFLFLNGLHTSFLDPVMFWGSKSLIWLPLYLFLVTLVIRRYGWRTLWVLLFAALMVLVSDQLSNIFKEGIGRLRPSHQPGLAGVHLVNGYVGGLYGFYSAHASTTMATALFSIILLRHRNPFVVPVMVCWAVFMSYTRIYLGVHYPGDILAGMVMGGLIGWITGTLCVAFLNGISKRATH